ncbi:MAG: GntR family transcriptional regulator [Bacillota bacterium]
MVNKLDSESPVPLYHQLELLLEKRIKEGYYQSGDLLPTEQEAVKNFNLSRTTVRRAFEGLLRKGMIKRKRGVGTIVVKKPKIMENLPQLKSFTEDMEDKGYKVYSRVLEAREIIPPDKIRKKLKLDPEQRVLKIKRLRYVDEEPIVIQNSHLPAELGIKADEDFRGSLYKLLEEKYGIYVKFGSTTIEAAVANQEESELLDIKEGEPVLIIDRLGYDADKNEIEFVEGVYRGDRHKYQVNLKR